MLALTPNFLGDNSLLIRGWGVGGGGLFPTGGSGVSTAMQSSTVTLTLSKCKQPFFWTINNDTKLFLRSFSKNLALLSINHFFIFLLELEFKLVSLFRVHNVFKFTYSVYSKVLPVLLAFPFRLKKHSNTAAIIASAVEVNFLRLG